MRDDKIYLYKLPSTTYNFIKNGIERLRSKPPI